MNRINIWNKDNEKVDLEEYGMIGLALIPESPSYEHYTEKVPGSDGLISLGKDLNERNITARFYVRSFDYTNSLITTDDLFDLFNGEESFYIGEVNQPYKRWLVDSVSPWTPERNNNTKLEVTLELVALKGHAESIGTTTMASTFTHLDTPVNQNDYRNIRATKFRIYNPGKPIDPRSINDHLKITMVGQSNNLRIRNLTTGDVWQYSGSTNANQSIVLEGIRSTRSGLSIFRDTNKKLISLAHGWNDFEVTGSPNAKRSAIFPRRKMSESERPNPFTFEFIFKF